MIRATRILSLAIAALAAFSAHAASTREKLVQRLVDSEYSLAEIMASSDTAIPASVLKDAKGLIITVNYRGSFFFGAQGGSGVLLVKNPISGNWCVPSFVSTGGANFGLQMGVKELDTIYVIMDDSIVRKAITGRFDIGADASAVAGPAGVRSESRSAEYAAAQILVYTKTKGLYAGVAVKAGWISPDSRANKLFYDTDYNTPEIILSDWFKMPSEAKGLVDRVNYYMNGGQWKTTAY